MFNKIRRRDYCKTQQKCHCLPTGKAGERPKGAWQSISPTIRKDCFVTEFTLSKANVFLAKTHKWYFATVSKIKKNKNGFTLIEIMVVVVIVGILASLALMNYTAVVDRTKIAEAKSILLNSYAGYERMMFDSETISGANPLTWARLGMSDPGAEANRHFDYTFRPNANAPTSIRGTFIKDNSKYVQVSLTTGALTIVNF